MLSYAAVREKAMLDLVRDPREVVYAADEEIAGLRGDLERFARGVRCADCTYWRDDRIGADWGTCSHKDQRSFMPPTNRHEPCTLTPSRWRVRQ
jgi:hypothetical protein